MEIAYTRRLVLITLMLRSVQRNASASLSTVETALRCVSKHEGAPLVLILRDTRARVSSGGTISYARSSG